MEHFGWSDGLLLACDGSRVVSLRPSLQNDQLLRVYSASIESFSLQLAFDKLTFNSDDDRLILIAQGDPAWNVLQQIAGSRPLQVATILPDPIRVVLRHHFAASQDLHEWYLTTPPAKLPQYLSRLQGRIGNDGLQILGAILTFGPSRAAYRLAVETYVHHRKLEDTPNVDDALKRELVAWNLLSQTFVALESLCAMFNALMATRADPPNFTVEYLRFGRGGGGTVSKTMSLILGDDGPATIAQLLGIATAEEDLPKVGLDECKIEPDLLVAAGKYTAGAVTAEFRRLARFVVAEFDPQGRAVGSTALKAYGAFRHGFAAGFPIHSGRPSLIGDDPGNYRDEAQFIEHWSLAQSMAELIYLGDKDADGNRPVERVTPPVYSRQLKPYVQIVYLANRLNQELAKYAQSLFGSIDGRFPYLLNSSLILGPERRQQLQIRLDYLEGR